LFRCQSKINFEINGHNFSNTENRYPSNKCDQLAYLNMLESDYDDDDHYCDDGDEDEYSSDDDDDEIEKTSVVIVEDCLMIAFENVVVHLCAPFPRQAYKSFHNAVPTN